MTNKCLIIGGGIAALRAAKDLATFGVPITLANPTKELGETAKMFKRDISDSFFDNDILDSHLEALEANPNIILMNNTRVTRVIRNDSPFEVEIKHNGTTENIVASTVILAPEFTIFNAEMLGEYGYGILEGVLTIFDLEIAFRQKELPTNDKTERIVFVLCVGSRTLRDGANPDCSTYCCSYSISQALQIKKEFPTLDVVLIYMDIRTVASHEYLYNKARKAGIIFIRGRISAIERSEGKLATFIEDTLVGSQDFLPADLFVLAVGAMPFSGCDEIALNFGVELTPNGFVKITEQPVSTSTPGVFACGSGCDGIKSIQQSLSEGGAAAMAVIKFLTENQEI
ncbi:MAG: FAD-dependent oxidoreductase [Candidatus Hodarchaeota archaeon]